MMMPLPEAIIAIWAPFAALFTQPVWCHVQGLKEETGSEYILLLY